MNSIIHPTLYTYVQQLPYKKETSIDYPSQWEQSREYKQKPTAMLKVERLFLCFNKPKENNTFTKTGNGNGNGAACAVSNTTSNIVSQNTSFWNIVCKYIDETHSVVSKSYQQSNRSFLMTQLKDLVVQSDVKKYLTSRRMYPILEMLDHPRTEFTKKHCKACGFFLAFLLGRKIQIEEEVFTYSIDSDADSDDSSVATCIHIKRNPSGFWYEETLDKK